MPKWKYKYEAETDTFQCPNGKTLTYSTTESGGYRQYKSDPTKCGECPLIDQCTRSANHQKVITRHVWEDQKDQIREYRLSDEGKYLYKKRKETIERNFADSKELHGLRYCRLRGRENVQEQA